MLRGGNRLSWLSRADGSLTAAGNEYEARTGSQLPPSGLQAQNPLRKGNTETIKLRSGKRVVTRRFDGDEWKFTKAGNQFYKQLKRNFVVSLRRGLYAKSYTCIF